MKDKITNLIDHKYIQNKGHEINVNIIVTNKTTITNPPTEVEMTNPGKFDASFTSTSSILKPSYIPLQPYKIHVLKSFIKLRRLIVVTIIPATVPIKNATYAAKTISSSIIYIVVNLV
jgi:hypothetical protein